MASLRSCRPGISQVALFVALAACSGSSGGTKASSSSSPLPQVALEQADARLVVAPEIVTVTFGSDADVAMLESFGDTITQTPWWDAVRAGYCNSTKCIGQGTSGGHVRLTETPPAMFVDAMGTGQHSSTQDFIAAHVASGVFPTPNSNTVYVIYLPRNVGVTLDGVPSCVHGGVGGYHNTATVMAPGGAASLDVVYVVIPRSAGGNAQSFCPDTTDDLTTRASHEIIEGATDPDARGFVGMTRIPDALWASSPFDSAKGASEIADLCFWDAYRGSLAGADMSALAYTEGAFAVTRSWSNVAAAARHDPCVPAPAIPYFNVTPIDPYDQTIALHVGETRSIALSAFAEGGQSDWQLDALELTHFNGDTDALTLAIDTKTVHDGAKISLSVTLGASPPKYGAPFVLVSTSGTTTHTWPLAVYQAP